MRDEMRAVTKAGAKVAKCRLNLKLAMRELESAEAAVLNAPKEIQAEPTYTVKLTHSGVNRIGTIKAIRQLMGNGLKEAKDISDAAGPHNPQIILKKVTAHFMEQAKKEFEQSGATFTINKHH